MSRSSSVVLASALLGLPMVAATASSDELVETRDETAEVEPTPLDPDCPPEPPVRDDVAAEQAELEDLIDDLRCLRLDWIFPRRCFTEPL